MLLGNLENHAKERSCRTDSSGRRPVREAGPGRDCRGDRTHKGLLALRAGEHTGPRGGRKLPGTPGERQRPTSCRGWDLESLAPRYPVGSFGFVAKCVSKSLSQQLPARLSKTHSVSSMALDAFAADARANLRSCLGPRCPTAPMPSRGLGPYTSSWSATGPAPQGSLSVQWRRLPAGRVRRENLERLGYGPPTPATGCSMALAKKILGHRDSPERRASGSAALLKVAKVRPSGKPLASRHRSTESFAKVEEVEYDMRQKPDAVEVLLDEADEHRKAFEASSRQRCSTLQPAVQSATLMAMPSSFVRLQEQGSFGLHTAPKYRCALLGMEEPPERRHERKVSAFTQLHVDGDLHRDDLAARSLELMGHDNPNAQWIQEVVKTITVYSGLPLNEFCAFVDAYEMRVKQACRDTFRNFDASGDGLLQIGETRAGLAQLGLLPRAHVLKEVIDEHALDSDGTLDIDGFKKLMASIHELQGFSQEEVGRFARALRRYGASPESGYVTVEVVVFAMQWLGIGKSSIEECEGVFRDTPHLGQRIALREFVICMKNLRESEIVQIRRILGTEDTDVNQSIWKPFMTESILRHFHFIFDHGAVDEVNKDVNAMEPDGTMTVSSLWSCLTLHRERYGFNRADLAEMDVAHAHYAARQDTAGNKEIPLQSLGLTLRSMGYVVAWDSLQNLAREVDLDGGPCDLQSVLRMCRSGCTAVDIGAGSRGVEEAPLSRSTHASWSRKLQVGPFLGYRPPDPQDGAGPS